jgi:dTDP-4-dehydrorhamnose reductase
MVLKPKVLFTGGTGRLGQQIALINDSIIMPPRAECDILDEQSIQKAIDRYKPQIIVHAAAYTDVKNAENDIVSCMETNVVGVYNILKKCIHNNVKMVYISTDAVFDGKAGSYQNTDKVNPISVYAKSKTAAEIMVQSYKKSLVIRTSFFGETFPYDSAFIDQWTSKDYIDIMAPKILKACLSNSVGIKHVASKRRSLYELAKLRKQDVVAMSIDDFNINFDLARDLSLKE